MSSQERAMFVGGPVDGRIVDLEAGSQSVNVYSGPTPPPAAWDGAETAPAPYLPGDRVTYVRVNDPALEASTGYVFFTPQTSSAE